MKYGQHIAGDLGFCGQQWKGWLIIMDLNFTCKTTIKFRDDGRLLIKKIFLARTSITRIY